MPSIWDPEFDKDSRTSFNHKYNNTIRKSSIVARSGNINFDLAMDMYTNKLRILINIKLKKCHINYIENKYRNTKRKRNDQKLINLKNELNFN